MDIKDIKEGKALYVDDERDAYIVPLSVCTHVQVLRSS